MQKLSLIILLFVSLVSCREVEEKFLYDKDDPRLIELERAKCLEEKIYDEIKLVNDFSRYTLNKSYLFKRTSKIGTGTESTEAQWGVVISAINPGVSMTVSIRKPQEVYHLTYSLADSEAIVDIVTNGTCAKDKYKKAVTETSIKFSHVLRRIIEASTDPNVDPPRYDEYTRNFYLSTEVPALFYYFKGSIVEKKIQNGNATSTTTYTHSLSDLDCTNSDNNKFCRLTGNAENGTPLEVYNCTTVISSSTIYTLENISDNASEASLVKFTPTTDKCNTILF